MPSMYCPDCESRLANVQGYETCPDCGYVQPLDRRIRPSTPTA